MLMLVHVLGGRPATLWTMTLAVHACCSVQILLVPLVASAVSHSTSAGSIQHGGRQWRTGESVTVEEIPIGKEGRVGAEEDKLEVSRGEDGIGVSRRRRLTHSRLDPEVGVDSGKMPSSSQEQQHKTHRQREKRTVDETVILTTTTPPAVVESCFMTRVSTQRDPVYSQVRQERLTCYTALPFSVLHPWCNTTVVYSQRFSHYRQTTRTSTVCCGGWSTDSSSSSLTDMECSKHTGAVPPVEQDTTPPPQVTVSSTPQPTKPPTQTHHPHSHQIRSLRQRVEQLQLEQRLMIERLHREISLVTTLQEQLARTSSMAVSAQNGNADCQFELLFEQSRLQMCQNQTRSLQARISEGELISSTLGPFPAQDPCQGLACPGYPDAVCLLQDQGCCASPRVVWLDISGEYVGCEHVS